MAAGAWQIFGSAKEALAKATIDLDTDAFRMVLVTSGWTPAVNTDDTWSDLSPNEASGTGYTTHGKLLTMSVSRASGTVTVDCDDQSWATATLTAKYAVIVKDANGDGALAGTDLLLCYSDLNSGGGSVSSTAAAFSITIAAGGLFTLA